MVLIMSAYRQKSSQHYIWHRGNDRKVDFLKMSLWNGPTDHEWPLFPFCVEEVKRSIPYHFHEDFCPYLLIVAMLDGTLNYRCGDRSFNLTSGNLLLIPLYSCYSFRTEAASESYHKLVFEIKGPHLAPVAEALDLASSRIIVGENIEQLVSDVREIGDRLDEHQEQRLPWAIGKTFEILHRMSLCVCDNSRESKILRMAKSILENKWEQNWSIPAVAEEVGVSSTTLNRLFRTHLNTTPAQYRIAKKTERAKYLLRNTSLSVKEIAFRLGYCNQFYFSQEFKRICSCSPSEFSKQKMFNSLTK